MAGPSRHLKVILLMMALPCSSLSLQAFEVSFKSCLAALSTHDIAKTPSPLAKAVLRYDGIDYLIPEKFFNLAQAITKEATITEYAKHSYLSALTQLFLTKNLFSVIKGESWQNAFNLRINKLSPIDQATDVAIVVHQLPEWQETTSAMLSNDPLLKKVPVISLNSAAFPLQSEKLLQRATQIRWSEAGEISGVPLNTNRFHLFGGYCRHCMSTAIQSIALEKVNSPHQKTTDIFVYSSLSYLLQEKNPIQLAKHLNETEEREIKEALNVWKIARNLPQGADFSGPFFETTEHGPAYRIEIQSKIPGKAPIRIYLLAK